MCHRVAERPVFEKRRRFFHRRKNRVFRQMGSDVSLNCHPGFPIIARHMNGEGLIVFSHVKACMMMDAGKEPSTNEGVELRRGVSPGNIDPFSMLAMLLPLHRDAVSGILRRETEQRGQRSGAELLEANETDACYSQSMDAFWPKWGRQESLEIVGINTVIHEETPIYDTFKGGNIHTLPHSLFEAKSA
jgi:hypothetical protein